MRDIGGSSPIMIIMNWNVHGWMKKGRKVDVFDIMDCSIYIIWEERNLRMFVGNASHLESIVLENGRCTIAIWDAIYMYGDYPWEGCSVDINMQVRAWFPSILYHFGGDVILYWRRVQ